MSLSSTDVRYFKTAVGLSAVVKETSVDVTARCPVCGDSKTNTRKARLHLYNKGDVTNVNCFNGDCPCTNKSVWGFLKEFFPALVQGYKRETFGANLDTLLSSSTGDVFANLQTSDANNPIDSRPEVICQDLSPYFTRIEESPNALEYCNSRGLPYSGKFGSWFFGHQDLKIGEVVYPVSGALIVPLYCGSDMYGFYSRSISTKSFYTYMDDQNIGFKIFNWFNVDKTKPVYIFEGVFDCIASGLTNSIALLGAKIPAERLLELSHAVFVLDNDRAGLVNSLHYCSKSYVYIQPHKYIEKDLNDLMLNYPNVDVSAVVKDNLYTGIQAEIAIKAKL